MRLNASQREITLKVVYYGPPLSGKTTNLQEVHRLLAPDRRGHLTTLNTADERTLFFDMLPVLLNSSNGYRIILKMFTVPGQNVHAATRRMVLANADAVVFVADSQIAEAATNNDYWHGMHVYFKEMGIDLQHVPLVIQFNKRDLPNVRSDSDIEALRQTAEAPIYTAVAVRGEGVLETLHGLLDRLFPILNARYQLHTRFNISGAEFMTHMFGGKLAAPPMEPPHG